MKLLSLIFLLFLSLESSISVFPQKNVNPAITENNPAQTIGQNRITQIKADILLDIKSLPNKEKARKYAELGVIFWDKDKKEGLNWLNRGIEIALNPATIYKDNEEKAVVLQNILIFDAVLEKDQVLGQKLISQITEIYFAEASPDNPVDYSLKILSLADWLAKKDEKLSYDLAVFSLKNKKLTYDWTSFNYLGSLKKINGGLADQYFKSLTELAKTSGDRKNLEGLIALGLQRGNLDIKLPYASDSQKREILEILAPFVQKESEELSQKNRNDCDLTKSYGARYLNDYKTLLPEKVVVMEQAINICNASGIDNWKKPDFFKNRNIRTSQDHLNLAKEINDKEIQRNYIRLAAQLARNEKNYRFSIEILDSMDEESREKSNGDWEIIRYLASRELISELLKTDNFAEITETIEKAPQKIRPFVILEAIRETSSQTKYKQFKLDLVNLAKMEFNRTEFPEAKPSWNAIIFNPAYYFRLIEAHISLGFQAEALETFDRFIEIQNLLSGSFAYKNEEGEIFAYTYYSTLPSRFMENNFERIYQNVGKLDSLIIRLDFRMSLLREQVNINSGNSRSGITKISY